MLAPIGFLRYPSARPAVRRLLPILAAALVAAACADQSATQYVGVVMNESDPEAEGSLRLTLFERSDTAFSGVMELGAPAAGTGSAYAWHEQGELRIVTVGATTSDTIYWSSRLSDAALGGQFEITGGERAGQTGTWRGRLVKGMPASPATLQRPRPTPLPPWTATWPAVLLAIAVVLLARWIRRAPAAAADAADGPRIPIGGWLTFFMVAQVLGILASTARLGMVHEEYVGGLAVGAAIPVMQPLIVLETIMQLASGVVAAGGLWLTAKRSRYAPRYWLAYFGTVAAYVVVDLFATRGLNAQLTLLVGTSDTMQAEAGATTRNLLRQLAVVAAWAAYWVRSRRVRTTFGAAALDRIATPRPTSESPRVATPGTGTWVRGAIRVTVGAVAVLLALAAIGVWTTRATPWSVAEGQDIRDVVAGRWTWASDSSGCAGAHTIAFAEDGKVMTIQSGGIGAADPVTTYDIEVVSRSTIRGAIRGETRTADDGSPVVWDLVLTSPDEYRWTRTDWTASPWSYTGSIVRCPPPEELSAGP